MTPPLRDAQLEAIAAALGRPLRVLHIGNIANNAYNNARVQRQYGVEADVLCHDYYHVMGTPEWEDGGLATRPDPDLPNWWTTNLGGFSRPDWYAQGPLNLCLDYLDARRSRNPALTESSRAALEMAYVDLLRMRALSRGEAWRDPRPRESRHPVLSPLTALFSPRAANRGDTVRHALARSTHAAHIAFLMRVHASKARLRKHFEEARRLLVWPLLAGATAKPPTIAAPRLTLAAYRLARRLGGRDARDAEAIAREAATLIHPGTPASWRFAARTLARLAPQALADAFFHGLRRTLRIARLDADTRDAPSTAKSRAAQARKIVDDWTTEGAPPTLDQSRRDDLIALIAEHALLFAQTLKAYDIVQGYSTDGFIPLVNGLRAFASYEHGTLRELPFENSLTGLICNIAYRRSPAVFITNTDVLPSVERLGLNPSRVYRLPHAFDDRKLMDWRDKHAALQPPDDCVVFFSPTRQHWRDANRSLTKGNDVMLHAAGRLWAQGRRFRLVLVEWGADLEESRRLIDALGYASAVEWVAPMGKQDLWRAYCTSHAILDQFVLPALGGVGFEALALGRRLITHTDQPTLEAFFGEAPPVFGAADVSEVETSMREVLDDPHDASARGPAGRLWIAERHSAKRIVEIQAEAYARLLDLPVIADSGATLDRSTVRPTPLPHSIR